MTTYPLALAEHEDRKRRLEADAADARKALVNARAHYDRLCEELRELRLAWTEQPPS